MHASLDRVLSFAPFAFVFAGVFWIKSLGAPVLKRVVFRDLFRAKMLAVPSSAYHSTIMLHCESSWSYAITKGGLMLSCI